MVNNSEKMANRFGLFVSKIRKMYVGRPILCDVSLELNRGEVVGLFGPNGAGKTSCFYIVAGIMRPDFGAIHMDGIEITHMPMFMRARLGLGYLPQENSVFRGLSVQENVMAVLEVVEKDASVRKNRLSSLLEDFSIGHLKDVPSIALSGGECRRLEMARALAMRPQYILLDEPLAGVDPVSVVEIGGLIGLLKEKGIGVLITDHNVRETLEIVDRAYILYDGKMIIEGNAQDIVNDETVKRVYLGERFSL